LGSTANGAKAGVVAGVLYGVVLAILSYFTVVSEKSLIISAITNKAANSPFTPEQLYGIVLIATPIVVLIGGLIGGTVVGALYGRLFERIPGGSSTVRGIVVGIALWLVLSVLGGIGNLQYGALTYLSGVVVGLVSALLFGFVLGYFYGRFIKPKETYELKQDTGALKAG
jgi:hypothetical protein